MILRKVTLLLAATIGLAASATAVADNGQFGLGFGFQTNIIGMGDFSLLTGTYLNNQFILQGGLGYKNWKANGSNNTQNIFTTSASAGLREMTSNSVSLDYGVLGNYCFANGSSLTVNPYSLGGYVGVDYTATKNMLLTARVVAYNYSRGADKTKYNNFFHGTQENFKLAQARDRKKSLWCTYNDIRLVVIRATDTEEEIVKKHSSN